MSGWIERNLDFVFYCAACVVVFALLAWWLKRVLRAERNARLALEGRLRESEARLRTAIDSLPCDFWMMDAAGRYSLFNAAARADWGDNTGRTLDELDIPPATRAQWAAVNRRAFAGELVHQETSMEVGGRRHHFMSIVACGRRRSR
jgi:two-component system, cell cycle sensor histidine kinase and response regulator CckA